MVTMGSSWVDPPCQTGQPGVQNPSYNQSHQCNNRCLCAGSPPLACERSSSSGLQKNIDMTRRSDSYLPVPGEEKSPDVEFVNSKAKNNESIVRAACFKERDTMFSGTKTQSVKD